MKIAVVLLLAGFVQPALTVKYQGRTADFWAERLRDADYRVSRDAADALRAIGAESLPYLVSAIKTGKGHVKMYAAGVLATSEWVKDYPKLAPVIVGMFKDADFNVRTSAAEATRHLRTPETVAACDAAFAVEIRETTKREMLATLRAAGRRR